MSEELSARIGGVRVEGRDVCRVAARLLEDGLPRGEFPVRLVVDPALPADGYRVEVSADQIVVGGGSGAGVFYGVHSILPPWAYRRARVHSGPWTLPIGVTEDAPRFGWRGCMLDVARHFLPKADVLRYIDLIAMHRLNVLHLHLTDDQGWRVQIERYPRLTEVGAWRRESMVGPWQFERFDGRPHGGFYTQDDLREIVAYAADRFVTVVPEIDMPGHVQAAIAAYPELGSGASAEVSTRWGVSTRVLNVSEETIAFFRHVLDEVMDVFPSERMGIGGDECRKDEWRASPSAQQRIRELGLSDEDELQAWFVGRIQEHLHARGRRLFGWDEILEGGRVRGATVAAWRGRRAAVVAARAGHEVVMCPDTSVYLDYRQSARPDEPIPVGTVLTLDDVCQFDVLGGIPPELRDRVIGAQCNIWTEHADSVRALDYLAFPRLTAFADGLWTQPSDLDARLARLDAIGVEYRPLDGPLPWQTRPDTPGRPRSRADREAELAEMTANLMD